MNTSLIVSVVGPDRPGLVEKISAVVSEAGGNWEGSRLIQLAGQFAGMIQVTLPEEQVADLRSRLEQLSDDSLRVETIETVAAAAAGDQAPRRLRLEVVGQDRNGIVAAISKTLAAAGVNVAELATDCRNAPWSGDRMFETHAVLEVPADLELDLDTLRERVEDIAGDLMVELGPEVG